jgi:hypothetical protein
VTWTITADCRTVPLNATADAWIEQNSPSQNKGTDSVLKVRSKSGSGNARALVLFGNLPVSVPVGCVLQSATLRLYSESSKASRTIHATAISGAWTENGVTWSNQPGTTGTAATTTTTDLSEWRQWDVTSQVGAMFAGATNHGFLIRDLPEDNSGSPEQSFSSREKGQNVPQLVLVFGVAPAAAGTASAPPTLDLSAVEPAMLAAIVTILAVFTVTATGTLPGRRPLRPVRVLARRAGHALIA